ncbi:malonic semialdehyde reductase [Cellulomonas edaphi]|uniref:Malonic semialdehyde reductase n=1 Tax=Cellulomonas edaphi TaxID=3053468 RepID=A0ABT7S907_9CELL|nr:malonic semialdehyde reductase [Cellulomons edaphi]MDM7832108.1 malonic semialdehyde reductase [Cellulomons edaphi]
MTTDTTVLDGLDFPVPALAVGDDVADLLFRQARTIGTFTDQPVTDEELAAVYDLIKWGPTAINTTPLRLLVVRTPEARQRLAAHVNDGNRDRVLAAPVTLVVASDPGFHQHIPTLAPHMSALADALDPQTEQREQMARMNTLIQFGYLIVGLRAAGLDAGPMAGLDTAGVDAEFFAENGWQSQLIINVGHREGEGTSYPRAARLDYEQVSLTV